MNHKSGAALGAVTLAVALLLPGCGSQSEDILGIRPYTGTGAIFVPLDPAKPHEILNAGSFNMSIGFPVVQLIFTDMANDSIAFEELDKLYQRYLQGRPGERVKYMAKFINELQLDVVGLQEVMSISRNGILANDFLAELLAELKALGGYDYRVFRSTLNDTLLRGRLREDSLVLRFHEGNALLIRPGYEILDTTVRMYSSLLPILESESERSADYARIRSPNGVHFQIFNTHLEELRNFGSGQAAEFRLIADSLRMPDHAQILLGDLNADPGKDAHLVLTEGGFRDTRDTTLPGVAVGDGFTCCVANSRLWDSSAAFSNRRIDYIMARGISGLEASSTELAFPFVAADGGINFPSDHRLVRARILAQ